MLGIDETRRGRPRWKKNPATGKWERSELFETNFTGLAGDGRLLGQVAGRTGAAVTGWLDARGEGWKDTVQVVAIDPCAIYRSAVQRALPPAQVVVDHFHLVRLASQAVTTPPASRSGSATWKTQRRRVRVHCKQKAINTPPRG